MPCNCIVSCEYDLTASSSGGSAKALTDCFCSLKSSGIELRVKECVEVSRIDHCNCFLRCSHTFVNQVTSDLHSSLSCSLTVSCLEHVELTVLNCELHVLHVSVVLFECLANLCELSECFRELLLHLSDLHRSTNACNNVFALCVCKELTEEALLTCSRVTCESNACTAVVTHVTECHGLNVNCCTP